MQSYGRTQTQAVITQGAAGQLDLVAAPAGNGLVFVTFVLLSVSAAGTVVFQEGTGPTNLTGVISTVAGSLILGDGTDVILQTKTGGSKLSITSATSAVTGYIRYYIDTNP